MSKEVDVLHFEMLLICSSNLQFISIEQNMSVCQLPQIQCFLFIFQAGRNIRDLFEDLRDGHNLLSLLEVLSGEILVSFESSYPFL